MVDLRPGYYICSLFRFCRNTEHAIHAAMADVTSICVLINRRSLRIALWGYHSGKSSGDGDRCRQCFAGPSRGSPRATTPPSPGDRKQAKTNNTQELQNLTLEPMRRYCLHCHQQVPKHRISGFSPYWHLHRAYIILLASTSSTQCYHSA